MADRCPCAACTGLRIGELAALRTADLNLAAREVKVRATAVGVSKRVSSGTRAVRNIFQKPVPANEPCRRSLTNWPSDTLAT